MATAVCNWRLLWMLMACASLIGCSNDGKTAIEGTATWNGEPISKGYIELTPLGPGQIDGGDIIDGKFELRTNEGEKRVSVVAQKQTGMTTPTKREPEPRPIYVQYLPAEFNEKSELKVTASSSDPKLTIDLKGQERSSKPTAAEAARRKAQGGKGEGT